MTAVPTQATLRAALLAGLLWHTFTGAHAQDAAPGRTPAPAVQVTVTDIRGRHFSGLDASAFSVSAGGGQLEVFSLRQDEPVGVGVLLDLAVGLSGLYARPAGGVASPTELLLSRFARDGNPANEYTVIAFNKQPRAVAEGVGAGALADGLSGLDSLKLDGPTALYNACAAGAEALGRSRLRRRALLLVADGEEGRSRMDRKQLVRLLREGATTLHVVAVLPGARGDYQILRLPGPPRGAPQQALSIPSHETNRLHARVDALMELASVMGGRAYFPASGTELADVFGGVAPEWRSQYLLDVAAPAATGKGGWAKLKVMVKTPKGFPPPATVRSRQGFLR